jgi:hypothetical protein
VLHKYQFSGISFPHLMVESNWVSSWIIDPSRSRRSLDNQSQAVIIVLARTIAGNHSFSRRIQSSIRPGTDQSPPGNTFHCVVVASHVVSCTRHIGHAITKDIQTQPLSSGCLLCLTCRSFSRLQRVGLVLCQHHTFSVSL